MLIGSGSDVWQFPSRFPMNTLTSPAWDGDPFADAIDRALWQLGYANHFDTEAEAQAAVAHVLREFPGLAGLSLQFAEVA
jgi:hypothetical protein